MSFKLGSKKYTFDRYFDKCIGEIQTRDFELIKSHKSDFWAFKSPYWWHCNLFVKWETREYKGSWLWFKNHKVSWASVSRAHHSRFLNFMSLLSLVFFLRTLSWHDGRRIEISIPTPAFQLLYKLQVIGTTPWQISSGGGKIWLKLCAFIISARS